MPVAFREGLAPISAAQSKPTSWAKINQLIFNQGDGGGTPVNTSPPVISVQGGGAAAPGSTLQGTPGTWTSLPTLTYQWLRNGAAIPGETNVAGYTVVNADRGTSITLLEIPNGEIMSGVVSNAISVDALAGIEFALRLQTHNGDNVPMGLYQDVACTIPAVNDFDLIAAWRDELGNSGRVAIQPDPDKQPVLLFNNGVPTVSFDGLDDELITTLTDTASQTIFQCAIAYATASFPRILSYGEAREIGPFGAGSSWAWYGGNGGGIISTTLPVGDWGILTVDLQSLAAGNFYQNGVISGASFNPDDVLGAALSIGSQNGSRYFTGDITSVFVSNPSLIAGNIDLTNSYLATINAPLIP